MGFLKDIKIDVLTLLWMYVEIYSDDTWKE